MQQTCPVGCRNKFGMTWFLSAIYFTAYSKLPTCSICSTCSMLFQTGFFVPVVPVVPVVSTVPRNRLFEAWADGVLNKKRPAGADLLVQGGLEYHITSLSFRLHRRLCRAWGWLYAVIVGCVVLVLLLLVVLFLLAFLRDAVVAKAVR
jgi:hypothetical protein